MSRIKSKDNKENAAVAAAAPINSVDEEEALQSSDGEEALQCADEDEALQSCSPQMRLLFTSLMGRVSSLEQENKKLSIVNQLQEGRIDRLEVKNAQLKERVIDGEERSMMKNLIFTDVPEVANEDYIEQARMFFRNKLQITMPIDLDWAHRIPGYPVRGRPRLLIVAFVRRTDRQLVLSRGRMLQNTNMKIVQQFPPERRTERSLLFDQKKAMIEANSEAQVRIVGQRLIRKDEQGRDEVVRDLKKEKNKVEDKDSSVMDVAPELRPISGRTTMADGSAFRAHFVPLQHISQLRAALASVCAREGAGRATHNMWALRLDDYEAVDDYGEFGGARHIINAMRTKEVSDGVCVVTRFFAGTHIGRLRFETIKAESELILDIHKASRY